MSDYSDSVVKNRFRRIKALIVCGLLMLAGYYLLPLVSAFLEPAEAEAFMGFGLLHLTYPLYLYISSILLGFRHGFVSIYAVAAAVLFLPTLLIYFQPTVWPAALIYGGIALFGNLMGFGLKSLLQKLKNQ